MADEPDRNPVAVPADAGATPPAPAALDANGFDPKDFEWRPVPRRARADGWTPEVQQRFIEALARTGMVERACEEVGMSVSSAYKLRNAPGGEGFARAWAAVLARAADRLLDIAFEQAIEGQEIPIFDQDGVRTGSRRVYNTRMAMFLLRAYHPERFRHAHRDTRAADEALPPPAPSVAAVTAKLAPVPPAEPHLLATPERLDVMLEVADVHHRYAPDEKEPYRQPAREEQHPNVWERARVRRARRDRLEEEMARREGLFDEEADRPPPRVKPSDPTDWRHWEKD